MTSLLIQLILDFISGTGNTLNSLFNNLFYLVFYIEKQFNSIIVTNTPNQYFDFNNIFKVVYTFASLVLIMMFIKKMLETYFAWQSGDPDKNPFNILLGFVKALIIMLSFGYLYDVFVNIMADFNSRILASATQYQDLVTILEKNATNGLFNCICALMLIILLLSIIFQIINRGIEVLILRIAIPFACIGLLNSDGGIFSNYIKKFLQNAFSVIIQLSLVNLSVLLVVNGHIIYAICTAIMAVRSPRMLQEIMISSSGLGVGGAVSRISERIVSNSMSRLLRKK